ncbi:pyridoxamine 5'-phosphate oxidase family protein [Modestobacter sp. VKM Ac-2986]|uniref:pyridoxamine 5'-phosphate oxidase family protein n=1 Tax=Modestobacter sp. VKM Ac-2986 TaxID=3004140 RepID=UPI0022AB41BD|nr:pyridoxamine 5'-phosphate oxidase family protein [Modestobacter sp. VKM Ac-2986]MCZ2827574.1 pyridoxamine 5'-phosphate oxidase family protein [Modestobacter sp. VKM Ac-2986]
MTSPDAHKVAELISGQRIAMLTTSAPQGTLTSRPMALQEVEFDGDLWFFAERSSRKVGHLDAHPEVNVTVGSGSTWVSLTGRAVVVDDPAKKRELWNGGVEAWFPDGPDDAAIVLIKVEGSSAEYWDTPGGRIATALSFAKAKVTGQPYDGGENETVRL